MRKKRYIIDSKKNQSVRERSTAHSTPTVPRASFSSSACDHGGRGCGAGSGPETSPGPGAERRGGGQGRGRPRGGDSEKEEEKEEEEQVRDDR